MKKYQVNASHQQEQAIEMTPFNDKKNFLC